jgi:hypothetical protein
MSEMEFRMSVMNDLLAVDAAWSENILQGVQQAATRVSHSLIAPLDELYAKMLQC